MSDYVIISGLGGSGKTYLSKILEEFGMERIAVGDIVREFLEKKKDKNIERGDYKPLEKIIEENPDFAGELVYQKTRKIDKPVIIESPKNPRDYQYIDYDKTKKIYIASPRSKRIERIRERDKKNDLESLKELKNRDARELDYGLGKIIDDTDIFLENYLSDTYIQMIRFRDYLRDLEDEISVRLNKYLKDSLTEKEIETKIKLSDINSYIAKNEDYWIDEVLKY